MRIKVFLFLISFSNLLFASFTLEEFTNLVWHRYEGNPIMYPEGTTYEAYAIFNCAITEKDGKFYMFYRAENWYGRCGGDGSAGIDKGGASRICLATSTNLLTGWQKWENNPVINNDKDYEQLDPPYGYNGGCEDPRILKKGDTYYMMYTGYSGAGARTCLATSSDLYHWTKHGPVINNKNGVILPVKINGRYYMYYGSWDFYWAYTTDDSLLTGWQYVNNENVLFTPRGDYPPIYEGGMETSAPPILCEDGILFLYFGFGTMPNWMKQICTPHTLSDSDATTIYALNWALMSFDNPTSVLKRANRPILVCSNYYEAVGQIYGALFGENLLRRIEKRPDGKFIEKWYFHYGGGDTYLCVAYANSPTNKKVLKYHLPVMSKQGSGFESSAVYNPSVINESGTLKMLYTSSDGLKTYIGKAESSDGFKFTRYPLPVIQPGPDNYDINGVDTPSLWTNNGKYYITYNGNDAGATPGNICLASSTDLINWKKYGEIFQPKNDWNKNFPVQNGFIIPQKINGKYVMYFEGKSAPYESRIGIAFCDSDDFTNALNWYEPVNQPVLYPRPGYFDSKGVRPAGTPVILSNSILLFYNGWGDNNRIMMGWVTFSKSDPTKVLSRCEKHIIMPTEEFEGAYILGSASIVYLSGVGYIYYGAGDKNIALALVNNPAELFGAAISTNTNIPPSAYGRKPKFVSGLRLEKTGNVNNIFWSRVSKNYDNTDFNTNERILYYKIYRSESIDGDFTLIGTTTNLYYQDSPQQKKTYYYKITAYNYSGKESDFWALLDSSDSKNLIAILKENEKIFAKVVIPYEVAKILWQNQYNTPLYLAVDYQPVNAKNNIFAFYDILIKNYSNDLEVKPFSFDDNVTYTFYYYPNDSDYIENSNLPLNEASQYLKVYKYNGIEFVPYGGEIDITKNSISIISSEIGRYALGIKYHSKEFNFSYIAPSKIFTPYGNFPHNEIRFYFENPEKKNAKCEIFNLRGEKIKELPVKMTSETEGYFFWDGKDENGKICKTGVYIYQIECGARVINGTVILAK